MKNGPPDYAPLLEWIEEVGEERPLPWHNDFCTSTIFGADGSVVATCASPDVAMVIQEVIRAFPDVVARMNRAEALDMTLIECAECGKGTRRREMLEHGTRGLLCLECCDRLFELTPFPVIEPDK